MIESAWPETKPWIISAICWIGPGFSTFKRKRTSTKKYQQQADHQQFHGKCLGDGSLRIVGLHVDRVQNLGGQIPEVLVQRSSDWV